jgi:hypothetical protein
MPDEPVADLMPEGGGHELEQILFNFLRSRVGGEPEALGESLDVGIDHNALGGMENFAQHDVGGFATDAGELGKLREGFGNLSLVAFE